MMESDIWKNFSLYNSVDLISRFYKEKHGREISSGKAHEIVSHLMQGQSYFASAKQAAEMIRPLLLWLIRGIR